MELTHSFTVPADLDETWKAFIDIEDVAGCFPGAVVTSVEGDEFKGSAKIKLGPISLLYNGTGKFLERDESAYRFVLEAKGKDRRGNGTAGATVTASMTDAGGGRTEVSVLTDLAITGKPAQFGRGMIEDVSNKLLDQFVACLESKVGAPEEAGPPSPVAGLSAAPDGTAAGLLGHEEGAAAEPGTATAPAAPSEGVTGQHRARAQQPQQEALDLGATVLPILLKSYWKQIAGTVLALLVIRWLVGRRH